MKKLLTVLALTVLAAMGAHAQTIVNLGGSTAGRTAVHNNILALLTGETYAYDGTSSAAKATRAIYHGTYNGQAYIIRTFWSGSVNGITPVVAGTQLDQFIDTSVLGTSGGENIVSPTLAPASANTVQQVGFSDIFASTVNETPADVEDEVGVITFKWYANKGSTGITNITPGLVRFIYGSSEALLSQFTGNPSDNGISVFPLGRNNSSGTRGTAMAESGYGNVVAVDQYTATASGGVVTALTPSGNDGSSSGSGVKNALNATYGGGVLIGYVGASDFAVDGVELTWNGVAYSAQAIQEGEYSFWGYLHMNRMNSLTGVGLSFYNGLNTSIEATPMDDGLLQRSTMNVARDADGAPIYPL